MTRWLLLTIVVWVASSTFASGDDWFKRFQLWNRCEPVHLLVGVDVSDDLGLKESQVTTAARSRLRAARMYIDPSDTQVVQPAFRVVIHGVDEVISRRATAVSIIAEFRKILKDHLSNENYYATTWSRTAVAAYMDSSDIISFVSQLMDEFIDEYLEVNESACHTPSSSPLRENSDAGPRLGPIIRCADGTPPPCS